MKCPTLKMSSFLPNKVVHRFLTQTLQKIPKIGKEIDKKFNKFGKFTLLNRGFS